MDPFVGVSARSLPYMALELVAYHHRDEVTRHHLGELALRRHVADVAQNFAARSLADADTAHYVARRLAEVRT